MSSRAAAGVWPLRLLIGAVVLAGAGCLAWAAAQLPMPGSWVSLVILAGLVAVASGCTVPIMIRAQQGISVTAAGVLVSVALLPGTWSVVCCAVGVSVGKAVIRRGPTKTAFNAAKDTLGAAAALAVADAVGFVPGSAAASVEASGWATVLVALLAAAAAYALVDELVPLPVVSLASGRPWRQVAFRGLGVRSVGRLADLALVVGVVAGVGLDGRLVMVAPAAILVAHLAYHHRLRVREERQTWRALLEAADTLAQAPTSGELDTVLRTAAARAATLFPGVEVEVQVGERLVRADADGVHDRREPAHHLAGADHQVAVAPLATELDTGPPAGWLRLYLRAQPEWSAREQEQLRSFAAATAGAVRVCRAYAAVAAAAADNAHDATHDPLTGLANRRRLHEHATAALDDRRGGQVALLLLDLDRFKEVNDTLGHAAGDTMLAEAAARLRTAAGDQLVARTGGDEFAVLLTGLPTPAVAIHRARQIVAALRARLSINGAPVDLAASGGIAVAGDHTDLPELYRRADLAMYQAKPADQPVRLGIYSRTRDWAAPHTPTGAAGATSTGQLEVAYQPIVALDTGRAVAAEAFIGWHHPEFGELPPGGTLAAVERSGLLTEVTDALLDQAIADATSWQQAGFPLQLAINLSPRNLADPQFAPTLLSKLDESGFHPRGVVIELNPTSTLGHLNPTSPGLVMLKDAGVQISLDDVTAEHARLSTLASIPFDQLKMDCSPIGDSSAAVALLCAIVALARRRDATVVAYGVSHDRQRELLWRHGCTLAQGNMFGRPATAATKLIKHLNRGYNHAPGVLAPPVATGGGSPHGHRVLGLRHGLSH